MRFELDIMRRSRIVPTRSNGSSVRRSLNTSSAVSISFRRRWNVTRFGRWVDMLEMMEGRSENETANSTAFSKIWGLNFDRMFMASMSVVSVVDARDAKDSNTEVPHGLRLTALIQASRSLRPALICRRYKLQISSRSNGTSSKSAIRCSKAKCVSCSNCCFQYGRSSSILLILPHPLMSKSNL